MSIHILIGTLKEAREDEIQVLVGPVTQARVRRFKEELNNFIIKLQYDTKDTCIKEDIQEHKSLMLIHIIELYLTNYFTYFIFLTNYIYINNIIIINI